MPWVDTHCHLQLDRRNPAQLLDEATDVAWVVVPGVDQESSRAALALGVAEPDRVVASAGLHPHDARHWPDQAGVISELAPGAAAVGETGLDFYRMISPEGDQIASFRAQIGLAQELGKPLIVHCRDAFAAVHAILEETGAGPMAVLHSWTGGTRWTRRFLDLGVTFSFSGTLAFDTAETIRLGAELVPPARALVETDTPYLAPPPHRGEPNQPAWVALVGRALAEVWGSPVDQVAIATSENAIRIFRG